MRNRSLELVVGTLFNFYKDRNSIPLFHSRAIVCVLLYGVVFNIYMITNDFMGMHFFSLEDSNSYVLVFISLLIVAYVYLSTQQALRIANIMSNGRLRKKGRLCTLTLFLFSFPLFIFLARNRPSF